MLSSPSSSYFLFNTPLMVTPFLSYNWKTKEKNNNEAREILAVPGDEQDSCNPQQGFPIRSIWPCRCDSQKVLPLKHLISLHSLCTPVNFSPISTTLQKKLTTPDNKLSRNQSNQHKCHQTVSITFCLLILLCSLLTQIAFYAVTALTSC